MIANLGALSTLAAHKVRHIDRQAVDDQQVSASTSLPKDTIQASGSLNGFP
jgi:hypothetical protein